MTTSKGDPADFFEEFIGGGPAAPKEPPGGPDDDPGRGSRLWWTLLIVLGLVGLAAGIYRYVNGAEPEAGHQVEVPVDR